MSERANKISTQRERERRSLYLQRALEVVEVHVDGLEEVVGELVEVLDRQQAVRHDTAALLERTQLPDDAHIHAGSARASERAMSE